jgi:prepilin-type N-terminal cleavage/methylation domain-containing protein
MKIKNSQSGMTLIELIVVVVIISLVSAVLMFSYSGFSNSANLRNLAQEVALSVRKSQVYATSVSRSGSSYGSYGVSFSSESSVPSPRADSKRFVLFADLPTPDNKYNSPSSVCDGECLEIFSISSGDRISKVEACTNTSCTTVLNGETLDIVFRRPSPDANICINRTSSPCSGAYSYARITIQSPKMVERTVSVWTTGQISVQ